MPGPYRLLVLVVLVLSAGGACFDAAAQPVQPCRDGRAGGYPCRGLDLLAHLPVAALGGTPGIRVNDLWGWTDPETGVEYALVGRSDGVAFVDLRDPANPVYLGVLPSRVRTESLWRDLKTYGRYLYVVAEVVNHGLQVFDLAQLRSVDEPPVTFTETAVYMSFGSAHNLAVDEDSGFAYVLGSQTGSITCGGGLHMVDLRRPERPAFAGCFLDLRVGRTSAGYTHDAQCVVYDGPDADYRGRQVCFGANETAISIADVTDKAAPVAVAVGRYPDAEFVHQGWLSDDHRWFFQGDERDETRGKRPTRTLIWDVRDLDDPVLAATFVNTTPAVDHNQYVRGDRLYQANYTAGLRVLDVSTPTAPVEVAYFDTTPGNDAVTFAGAWSVYPFLPSGVLLVSSIEEGLFVLAPSGLGLAAEPVPSSGQGLSVYPNPFGDAATVTVEAAAPQAARVAVYDVLGRLKAVLHDGVLPAGTTRLPLSAAAWPAGTYVVRLEGARGAITHRVVRVR